MSFVLPSQEIRRLVRENSITNAKNAPEISPDQIQPASIDFRLANHGLRTRASFLAGQVGKIDLAAQSMNLGEFSITEAGMVLEQGGMYLIPLMESVNLPPDLALFCNPKSSTGRLDIFARVICDGGQAFDQIPAGYKGGLWVELSPRSFPIKIYPGTRLVQGRFKIDAPTNPSKNPHELAPYSLPIHLDARGDQSNFHIGYRAKRNTPLIDVERINHYPLRDFWERIEVSSDDASTILDPSEFYIFASQEAVEIPPNYAAELAPIRTEVGEFRVHYAGFFDPGFGWSENAQIKRQHAARAVLEMRAHNVPFRIEHGQNIGKLMFEPLLDMPDLLYGKDLKSNYQGQGLKLSKHFKA